MENDKRHVGKRFADLLPPVPLLLYHCCPHLSLLQHSAVAISSSCLARSRMLPSDSCRCRCQLCGYEGGREGAAGRGAAAVQVYFTFGFGHRKSLAASCGIALSVSACACVQSALGLLLSLSLSCLQHYRINFF